MNFIFDDLNFWSIFFATEVLMSIGLAIWIWVVFIQHVRKSRKGTSGHTSHDYRDAEFEALMQRVAALEAKLKQMQSRPA
jgi:hypothetical protein